jgi:hypothetical protein
MILEEANRLYDNLLHLFTNSIMDNAVGASSSSDPKLSSTFSSPSNRSNSYGKKEPDISHNSKGQES